MTTDEDIRQRRKFFLGGLITGGLLGAAATVLGGMILRREVAKIVNHRLQNGLEPSSRDEELEAAEPPDDPESN